MKILMSAAIFLLTFSVIAGQSDTTIISVLHITADGKLFYRTTYEEKDSVSSLKRNDIYSYDYSTKTKSLFLEDYFRVPPPPMDLNFQHVNSLVFVKNNPANYVFISSNYCVEVCYSVKTENAQTPLDWGFVGDKGAKLFTNGLTEDVYLFVNDKLFKSTDGGNTWPEWSDSNGIPLSFTPIALAPDSQFFMIGYNSGNQLVGTKDEGATVFIIEPSNNWNENTKFYFDKDLFYYGVTKENDYEFYRLFRKTLNGNEEWMEEIASSRAPIKFALYNDSSGAFIYSAYKKIFKSTDKGVTFTELTELPHAPAGLFTYGSDFGVIFSNNIVMYRSGGLSYEIVRNSIAQTLSLMPLSIGNFWKYHELNSSWDIIEPSVSERTWEFRIIGDTLINGKKYFRAWSDYGDHSPFNYSFLRVDSLEGKIYGISPYSEGEELALDLLAASYDGTFFPQIGELYEVRRDFFELFGSYRYRMTYTIGSLFVQEQQFAAGIGVNYRYSTFDFGYQTLDLLGCVIDGVLYGDTSTVSVEDGNIVANEFRLYQNYPNPFNPATKIKYSIPLVETQDLGSQPLVTLKIYDVLGREVAMLVNERKSPGTYEVIFDAGNLPSGVYFYQLKIGGNGDVRFKSIKKALLLK